MSSAYVGFLQSAPAGGRTPKTKGALKDQMKHRLGVSGATGRSALWGQ